jgi:cytochrome c
LADVKLVAASPAGTAANAAPAGNAAALALAQKHTCTACHGIENKLVGPSFHEVARKYGERADAVAYLTGKIRTGGAGLWGAIPMPPQTLTDTDAQTLASWLAAGAKP